MERDSQAKICYALLPVLSAPRAKKAFAALPQEIAAHCAQYRTEEGFRQSVSAWTALFRLVEKKWGVRPAVCFLENGKPQAEGLFISLAHTNAAVAVCAGTLPCGIDVERMAERENAEALLSRFFPQELPSGGTPSERFLFAFTAREACGKLSGEGFFGKEKKAETILSQGEETAPFMLTERAFVGGNGYVLSLAAGSRCKLKKVRLFYTSKSRVISKKEKKYEKT